MLIFISLLYALFVMLLLSSLFSRRTKPYYILFKTISSLLFCLLAMYSQMKFHDSILSIFPFIFCLGGDVCLGFYNQSKNKNYFRYGLLSFLFGHLLFVYQFQKIVPMRIYDFIFPFLSLFVLSFLEKKNMVHIGKLLPLCMIYSIFVSLLLCKGTELFFLEQTLPCCIYFLACTLFYISDFIIVFLYFRKDTPTIHFFNLITYFLAMYLFAISPLF